MVQNPRSRLSHAAAYPGQGVYTRINSSFRGLRKPRPELAAAYFLSYKRPYCSTFAKHQMLQEDVEPCVIISLRMTFR